MDRISNHDKIWVLSFFHTSEKKKKKLFALPLMIKIANYFLKYRVISYVRTYSHIRVGQHGVEAETMRALVEFLIDQDDLCIHLRLRTRNFYLILEDKITCKV